MQVQIAGEVFKVKQVEYRLQEISATTTEFKDKTQDIVEFIQGRLTWLEKTKELLENAPIKALKILQLEYELIGFNNRATEKLIEVVHKTIDKCR